MYSDMVCRVTGACGKGGIVITEKGSWAEERAKQDAENLKIWLEQAVSSETLRHLLALFQGDVLAAVGLVKIKLPGGSFLHVEVLKS